MNESLNPDETSEADATKKDEPLPQKEASKRNGSINKKEVLLNRRVLSILGLQILIILLLIGVVTIYGRLHHIPAGFNAFYIKDIQSFSERVATFDFIGVGPDKPEPNFYSIVLEVFFWSWLGVLARDLYYLTNIAVRRKEFSLLESISKVVGNTAMGVAIAIAVVAFLRSTEFSIGNVNLTLKTANIELIGAISFILGFYHEDTRRLLGSFQKRVSGAVDETDKSQTAG
jgi:hypothetical protein